MNKTISIREELDEDEQMYLQTGDFTQANHSRKGSGNFVQEEIPKELTLDELGDRPFASVMMTTTMGKSQKKKRDVDMMLESTISEFKQTHETLVTQGNEEDMYNLFIKGENKFNLEVEAAKRMPNPKFLVNNEKNLEVKSEKIFKIHYDGKDFY